MEAARWQGRLDSLAEKHGVVGASLAVRRAGDVITATTGILNARSGSPATSESVFQIGSITKVWTATLVMQLVDDGLIDLDTAVVTYLPEFRVADDELTHTVTTRQLLCHSSGIDGDLFLDTGRGDDALSRYVAAMATLGKTHPRGELMSYCNAGFTLLGHLVATLRGTTWETALRERLIEPLGLTTAGTFPEEAILHPVAVGHFLDPDGTAVVAPAWNSFRSSGPAGLIHSTALEQLTFADLHIAGGVTASGIRLLSAEASSTMREPQIEVMDSHTLGKHWGLGWKVTDWDGHAVVGHDGATIGQVSFLRVLPDDDVAVCLLTNGGRAPNDLYEDLIGEIVAAEVSVTLPRRPEPPVVPLPLDPATFAGSYVREGFEATISETASGGLRMIVSTTGDMAGVLPDWDLTLVRYDEHVLLGRAGDEGAWSTAVFFDLAGDRYFHAGGRAFRKR